jgi:hypothetical protein
MRLPSPILRALITVRPRARPRRRVGLAYALAEIDSLVLFRWGPRRSQDLLWPGRSWTNGPATLGYLCLFACPRSLLVVGPLLRGSERTAPKRTLRARSPRADDHRGHSSLIIVGLLGDVTARSCAEASRDPPHFVAATGAAPHRSDPSRASDRGNAGWARRRPPSLRAGPRAVRADPRTKHDRAGECLRDGPQGPSGRPHGAGRCHATTRPHDNADDGR